LELLFVERVEGGPVEQVIIWELQSHLDVLDRCQLVTPLSLYHIGDIRNSCDIFVLEDLFLLDGLRLEFCGDDPLEQV